jgi:hypothetical protein
MFQLVEGSHQSLGVNDLKGGAKVSCGGQSPQYPKYSKCIRTLKSVLVISSSFVYPRSSQNGVLASKKRPSSKMNAVAMLLEAAGGVIW